MDIRLPPPDTTPPDTTLTATPPAVTNSASASFTFAATEAGSTFQCALDGGGFAPCASPQTYIRLASGNHAFQVRATDPAGNSDPPPASLPGTADTVAPDTTITATPPALTNSLSASFTFAATEAGSTFQCALDGGGFAPCASPQTYIRLASGNHAFQVRATDPAGNTDPTPASFTWPVDTVPPDTIITATPPALTSSLSASFTFAATEAGSTFQCALDGGGFAPCASPQTYIRLASGNHAFQVRATDPAGNTDPTPASFTWPVDTVPPDTIITATPPALTSSLSASFTFAATEAGSTFQCALDGGGFAPCASPQTYIRLASGNHAFQVRATDPAGNTDPTPASFTWPVDTVPPDTIITATPPALTSSLSASFTFAATEAGSTFQCALDGGGFAPCASPQTYSALASGNHTFQVRATDPAGNTDPTPASFTWTVDTVPPDTIITATPPALTSSASASFTFAATEAGSTFQCALDGGGFAPCASPQTYSALASGNHTFQVRATDPADHTDPTPASFTWTVDTAAPVRSGGQPLGTLPAGTTQTTLALTTNEVATCRYSPSAGVPYDAMTQTFRTAERPVRKTPVSGLDA